MRRRWLSSRAFTLHLAVLVWTPGCLVAGWWQVHRAFDGNGLSYLYSVEWPIFALVGLWGWWQLIHTDPEQVGRRAQERLVSDARAAELASGGMELDEGAPRFAIPERHRGVEDEALASYNDRLAALAARGPQTWRNR